MQLTQKIKLYIIPIAAIAVFVLLRFPSLLEPAWYGDEGIYATIAHEMSKGELLYRDIWDHKPPGIYLIYLVVQFLGPIWFQLFAMKFINLIFGLVTLLTGYKLLKLMFPKNKFAQAFPTILMAILLGSTLLEGNIFNAENIFIFFTTLGIYLFEKWRRVDELNYKNLAIVGFVFGLGVIFKIHPALDFIALFIFYFLYLTRDNWKNINIWKENIKKLLVFGFSSLLPLLAFAFYYLIIGQFGEFFYAVVTYNFSYSGAFTPTGAGFLFFMDTFTNRALVMLVGVVILGYLYEKKKISTEFLLLILWTVFAFFGVKLSSRPYPHYLIQLLPPIIIFVGWSINRGLKQLSWVLLFIFALMNLYAQGAFIQWGYMLPSYYLNGYKHAVGLVDQPTWYEEFNMDAENNKQLQKLLSKYKGENIYYWGNNPWVYDLADVRNPIKYTVYYHLSEDNLDEVMAELNSNRPAVILIDTNFDVRSEIKELVDSNYIQIDTPELNQENSVRFELYELVQSN